jgi:hypothetical protein
MRLLEVEGHWAKRDERHGVAIEACLVACIPGHRWVRFGAFLGEAPGSHMGLWHTDTGTVHGWNYRIGDITRCVTLLAHTRTDPR